MELNSAFILHRYPYSETSLLLKLFTREQGLIPVIAKGARAPKSKIRGYCQPFISLLVETFGRGEVKSLKQMDMAKVLPTLTGSDLLSAFYLNELLLALLPQHEPMPELFDRYTDALLQLANGSIAQTCREFEWHLLAICGYEISLEADQADDLISPHAQYELMPGQLPVLTKQFRGNHVYSGSDLLAIAQGSFHEGEAAKAAKRLMQQWLDFYTHGKLSKRRQLLRGCYVQESSTFRD